MLRVGLTGGIGAGKSTAAWRLAGRGAVLVDADVLAREVVAPGTDGLSEVLAAFGPGVLTAAGELDRPALGRRVFGDEAARRTLNAIVHPRVAARRAELAAAAPVDAVVVEDVPLLVETHLGATYHLVVVVHADVEERVRRLVAERGSSEADARARVAAQAGDDERRAAADVWLENPRRTGPPGAGDPLLAAVDALWDERLVPFEAAVRAGRPPARSAGRLVGPDPAWPQQAARLAARVARAAGTTGRGVEHVGATAVPGLPAQDVLQLQLAVPDAAAADAVAPALAAAGWPRAPRGPADSAGEGGDDAGTRRHASADPCRPADLHVRVLGSPAWRRALLERDHLRADGGARAAWSAGQRAGERAEEWAAAHGWVPPLPGTP
ncbi:dephospho-CoA kinase [Kineococcus sp. SYSU DK004]|uniref:dephospho-CoA kinase n=1 Tax=Kineococcus sp. SYSU DK004 TaxID=3383125 RepID=UPI003D7E3036